MDAPSSFFRALIAYAAILLGVLILGVWTIWEPFARDQGIHATIAFALREGLTTYSDVYNIKPPMTTGVHWLSQVLFGHSEAAIRLFDLVAVGVTGIALCALLRRFGNSYMASVLAVISFLAVYYSQSFWTRSQTDGWAGFLLVFALLAMVVGWQQRRAGWFAVAGAALGVAFALKYTIAGIGLAIFVSLIVPGYRWRWIDFVLFVAGGLGTLAVIAAVLANAGALPDFLEIQAFTLNYAVGFRATPQQMLSGVLTPMSSSPIALGASLIGIVMVILLAARRTTSAMLILVWLVASGLSYWSQGKGFPYHALPLIIAICAASALFWERLCQFLSAMQFGRIASIAIALIIIALSVPLLRTVDMLRGGEPTQFTSQREMEWSDFSVSANREAAVFLNAELKQGETLFLWGYETLLYFNTKRVPQHRYPYSWPFLVTFGDQRYADDLLARLNAAPPDVLVVENGDATGWVTGQDMDSREALPGVPGLQSFLEGYTKIGETPRYEYYRR